MPSETRVIRFSNDEIVIAIRDYCGQTERGLPDHGTIVVGEEKIPVSENSNGHFVPIRFSESEVATALMMFCMKESIPIPRRAAKSLQISPQGFSLQLEMG